MKLRSRSLTCCFGSLERRTPQPRMSGADGALTIRLATDNATWGRRHVHCELAGVGYRIGASTDWEILHAAGVDPS